MREDQDCRHNIECAPYLTCQVDWQNRIVQDSHGYKDDDPNANRVVMLE